MFQRLPVPKSFRPATRYFKWSLGRSVARSSRAEILDGSFLQPHILPPPPPPPGTPQYRRHFPPPTTPRYPPPHSCHPPSPATFFFSPGFLLFRSRPLPPLSNLLPPSSSILTSSFRWPGACLRARTSRLMTRVLSPAKPRLSAVNYPWMSYARPTLISQIVRKGRKVSINPRNENEAAPVSVTGVSPEKELRALFRSSAKDDEKENGKNVVMKNHGREYREHASSINLITYGQEYILFECEF